MTENGFATILFARLGECLARLEEGKNYRGKQNLGQVLDKMWLESWLAVFVIAKVMEQLLHGIAESLVLWVSIKLVADELDFVKDAVGVTAVFVAEEIVALVVKRVPTEGQSILQICDYVSQK